MERKTAVINNAFYEELDERWYTDDAHPIALLRKENETRNPWIESVIHKQRQVVLDIGCGAGFLSNDLAKAGHRVTGIDLSASSLRLAETMDATQSARYIRADAEQLPFEDESFDVVTAMDLLEHVDRPERVIAEASRVLKKGGLFFFHTFNRNWLSWLIVIKGVEWCVPNTPKNIHVYRMFIKPQELTGWCQQYSLKVQEMKGLRPQLSFPFWTSIVKRKVDERVRFLFSSSLTTGYVGFAEKTLK